MLRKILQPLYCIYAALVFVIGLVIVFIISFILSISNTLASRKAMFNVIKAWSRITLLLAGVPIQVIGKPSTSRHILVANHISYIDAANLFAARPDYFRALGKIELVKIPLFGFLYRRAVILVDRSSPESRAASMVRMQHFLRDEGNIFLFPEGTFNETGNPLKDFHTGAFRLAIIAQRPIVPLIFPDALDRLHYRGWSSLNPGRNRAVYLDPVQVDGMTIDDVPKVQQHVYTLMESALVKYQAE